MTQDPQISAAYSFSSSIATGAIGFALVSLCVFATVAFGERWMYRNLGVLGSYVAWMVLFVVLSGALFGFACRWSLAITAVLSFMDERFLRVRDSLDDRVFRARTHRW